VGPDETVLEHKCVDAVVDLGLGGIGSPFEKQNVIFIKLRFKVPFGLGYIREQLRKCVPDPRLTSLHLRGRHEEGVVTVIRRDAVDTINKPSGMERSIAANAPPKSFGSRTPNDRTLTPNSFAAAAEAS
jgi:hypothetical protein